MNLNEIAIFVKIVESGSFISAAKLLDMPKSTVSAKLSSLEKRLGTTLIIRTTRKLNVTPAGKRYYEKCLEAISLLNQAEIQVAGELATPYGNLKITAPVELGISFLPEILSEYNRKYPNVKVEVLLTDRYVDLVAEGVDLAIRVGYLSDSSLMAKKLGQVYFAPFVGKTLAKNLTKIKHPEELNTYNVLHFNSFQSKSIHLTDNHKETYELKINSNFSSNDLHLIKKMAMENLGITFLPTFLCLQEIKNGSLIRILKNWNLEKRPIHLVYPSQKFQSTNLNSFNELAYKVIKRKLDECEY